MNDILALVLVTTIVFLLLSVFIVSFFLFFQKRRLQHFQQTTLLRGQHAQELLETQIEIQNNTLQQVAQELHDNIGQLLSVARINLNILEELQHNPETLAYIQQTNEIIAQSIQDLRGLTRSLDGDFVKEFGLNESLSQELLRIRKTNKFHTELTISGPSFELGYEKEIVLFRIAQETLSNVLKHADATRINATLMTHNDNFLMSITDNGKGFYPDNTSAATRSGAGLRNMERRTRLIGGLFKIETKLGQGTTISVTLNTSRNHEN